jgi:hypothetical protein
MIITGAGLGLMIASPVFYVVASVAFSGRPMHADKAVGRWISEDGESSLAISGRNTAKFRDFPGLGTGKGVVRWEGEGISIGWPIKGYTTLRVSHWPTESEPRLIANDLSLMPEDDYEDERQ